MKTAILLMMTLAASSAFADPAQNTFTYRIKVPAQLGLNCAGHAQAIAQTFASETGLPVVSGACDSTSTLTEAGTAYTQEVLIITYSNDVELAPYRAVMGDDSFDGQSDASSGLFATYASCLAELAKLAPQFTAETGFAPVDAHCDASQAIGASGSYSLTIEGFGQPNHSLFSYSEDASIEGDQFAADVINSVIAALKAAGADVAYSDSTHVFYFSQYDPSVTEEYIGTYSVKEECSSQMGLAQGIFAKAGLTGAVALCEPFGNPGSTDTSLVVVGAGMTEATDDDYDQPSYTSFNECLGDLPRVLANAGAGDSSRVYGGLCAPSEDSLTEFQAHVYLGY